MKKISAVYKIVNTITGDFYIGSSKNVKDRWVNHKRPSTWKRYPNKHLYQEMQKYGVDKFRFQILAPVMPKYLKQVEQEFIDMLNPSYNQMNAKGLDVERYRNYRKSEKCKKAVREYIQSDKGKKSQRKYYNQLCLYNGKTLTLVALRERLKRVGVEHPTVEAKKFLIEGLK